MRGVINTKNATVQLAACCVCRQQRVFSATFSATWTMTISGNFYAVPLHNISCLHCSNCGATWLTEEGDAKIGEARSEFIKKNKLRVQNKIVTMLLRAVRRFFCGNKLRSNVFPLY